MEKVSTLRELRKLRGMTIEQLAEKSGLSVGFLSRVERGDRELGNTSRRQVAKALGVKPIAIEDTKPVERRTGLSTGQKGAVKALETMGAQTDGDMIFVSEFDVRPAAGLNSANLEVWRDRQDEATIGTYGFPPQGFRQIYGAPPDRVRIIEVVGDSMMPELVPGQKVMVDTGDCSPSPPGIFLVWDGLGMVIKRVEFLPHSDPARVRISSENARYEPYERLLGEAYIQGRVVGRWARV